MLLDTCYDNKVELKWTRASSNNDRIIEYIVYYNTSHDPPDRFRVMIQVPESVFTRSAVLNLLPWTTYSFHVTARNSLGESQRSRFTSELRNCSTPSAPPFHNPEKVCTVSRKEDELVIVWQVSRIQFSFFVVSLHSFTVGKCFVLHNCVLRFLNFSFIHCGILY